LASADGGPRSQPRSRPLEQLLRYCARPAISHDRLQLLDDGRVRLTLKTPRFDGTSRLILTVDEPIERLVAIIPRSHKALARHAGSCAHSISAAKALRRNATSARPPTRPSMRGRGPSRGIELRGVAARAARRDGRGGAEAKRAFDAMMTMQKIDVAKIETAPRG